MTFFSYAIVHTRITDLYRIDKSFFNQVAQIFLYLAVAHVGTVHYFRFTRAVFTDPEHIGYYFYIRAPVTDGRMLATTQLLLVI